MSGNTEKTRVISGVSLSANCLSISGYPGLSSVGKLHQVLRASACEMNDMEFGRLAI